MQDIAQKQHSVNNTNSPDIPSAHYLEQLYYKTRYAIMQIRSNNQTGHILAL